MRVRLTCLAAFALILFAGCDDADRPTAPVSHSPAVLSNDVVVGNQKSTASPKLRKGTRSESGPESP